MCFQIMTGILGLSLGLSCLAKVLVRRWYLNYVLDLEVLAIYSKCHWGIEGRFYFIFLRDKGWSS